MKYEVKTYTDSDGIKCKDILITDLMLHTAPKRKTSLKLDNLIPNKADRSYSPIEKPSTYKDGSYSINLGTDIPKIIEDGEKQGYKVNILIPKDGIPVFAGKDTLEFIESKNGKRILRKLAKDKEE